jgi:hypothetical protein
MLGPGWGDEIIIARMCRRFRLLLYNGVVFCDRSMGGIGQNGQNRLNKLVLMDSLFRFLLDRKGNTFGTDDCGPTDMLMFTASQCKSECPMALQPFLTERGFSGPDVFGDAIKHFIRPRLRPSSLSHITIIAAAAAFSRGLRSKNK